MYTMRFMIKYFDLFIIIIALSFHVNSVKASNCVPLTEEASLCLPYVDYKCTFQNSLGLFERYIARRNNTLGKIAMKYLNNNCNCKSRVMEIFCRQVLPECTNNLKQRDTLQCYSNKSSLILTPCFDYCRNITTSCFSNRAFYNIANVAQETMNLFTKKSCNGMSTSNCWKNESPFEKHCKYPTTATTNMISTQSIATRTVATTETNEEKPPNYAIWIGIGAGVALAVILCGVCLCIYKKNTKSTLSKKSVHVNQVNEVLYEEVLPNTSMTTHESVKNVLYNNANVTTMAVPNANSQSDDKLSSINMTNNVLYSGMGANDVGIYKPATEAEIASDCKSSQNLAAAPSNPYNTIDSLNTTDSIVKQSSECINNEENDAYYSLATV